MESRLCYISVKMELQKSLNHLQHIIKESAPLAVAYSGGVDSTFLLKVAHDVLKDNVIAITARSATFPEREFKEAKAFARGIGIRHIVIKTDELKIKGFAENRPDRCYLCKYELFSKFKAAAAKHHIQWIAEGSNADDVKDYRPGTQALKELGVVSPLREAGITKDAIRKLSKKMGLPTWDKPSFACLASRFPYGEKITRDKLAMVNHAEEYLLRLGFKQVRVRHHGDVARIEVAENERRKFFNLKLMNDVHKKFRQIGFAYCALDLKGYRTGSLNEVLNCEKDEDGKLKKV